MKNLFLCLTILIVLAFGGYFIYVNYLENMFFKLEVEDIKADINQYYIYGNHLNIDGILKLDNMDYEKITFILYNGEEKEYNIGVESTDDGVKFSFSEYLNDGMYLDNLERGKYYSFLRVDYRDESDDEEIISKYYALNNKTDYDVTTYYTLSKYNNKIVISTDKEYETMLFNVQKNIDKDIYDITIDPGHGGLDSGALFGDYKESDITMDISLDLKKYIEKKGYSVKITHDRGDIASDKTMDQYDEHGRAVIPNEVKSKFTFSIHINKNNSSYVNGIEIYTADGINYEFAKSIADSIINNTDLGYSTNKMHKRDDGVYTHNFTQSEINSSLTEYDEKGYVPYSVSTKSNYYYMIRETGGYMTGAYIDESNPDKVGINPYYNSNVGNESYLLELGYLSNSSDLEILLNERKKIVNAIGESIVNELGK